MTLPRETDAESFCESLVEERLAAGMNILGPCRSVFRWDGEVHHKNEWIVIAQVSKAVYDKFYNAVLAVHPYKTPCLIAVPIEQGYEPFLKWICDMSEEGRCV